MSDMHDAWFFIGVFVFIFLIWIATGGPTHPLAFSGPALAQPDVLGGGTYLELPRAAFGVGSGNVVLPGSTGGGSLGGSSGSGSTRAPSSLSGTAFGVPSPYRGVVTMNHYISGADADNPKDEYVELFVAQNAGLPINVTGWRLVSAATGETGVVPRGTEVPVSGSVNVLQDIVLSPGERALLISGRSPIGTSFRENKCIGYLGTFQSFSPPLPRSCPDPSTELATFYGSSYLRDTDCIDEVDRLSRCETVTDPPENVPQSCKNFMEKYFSYNGCVAAHKNDPDFAGDEWRIYLGAYGSLWRDRHEVLKLLDANGKTVDAFSY